MPPRQKVALITGAAGAIGAALVSAFAEEGYRVVATDIVESADFSSGVPYLSVDLDRLASESAYADTEVSQFKSLIGRSGLDVLINNAAIQILGDVDSLTRGDWRKSLNTNLLAPFFLVQALSSMLEERNGCVVNVSSIHARLTKKNFVAYSTTKAALSAMTRAMAVDLEDRVRVNAIEPAAIETPMLAAGFAEKPEGFSRLGACHPQRRIGQPAEVARLALALASKDYRFLHGACIPIDGGLGGRLHDPD